MRGARRIGCWLSVAALLSGCASSEVSDYRPPEGHIPRPDRILVYDFAAVPSELPPPVDIAGQGVPASPLTPAQLATGRALGQAVATKLTADLQAMGLPAVRAEDQPPARVGDGLLAGYFGFPADRAAAIAVRTVSAVLQQQELPEVVVFCCFSEASADAHRAALARRHSS